MFIDDSSGSRDDTKIGRAPVGAVCKYDRVSVIEDKGRFASATTATHELAHKYVFLGFTA